MTRESLWREVTILRIWFYIPLLNNSTCCNYQALTLFDVTKDIQVKIDLSSDRLQVRELFTSWQDDKCA